MPDPPLQVSSWVYEFENERILRGGRVCILGLLDRFLCLTEVYDPSSSPMYLEFVEETSDTLRRVKTDDSNILLGDFSAHVGNDAGVWRV